MERPCQDVTWVIVLKQRIIHLNQSSLSVAMKTVSPSCVEKKKPYRLMTVGSKEKKTKRQKIKGAHDRKFPSKQSCHDQEDC